MDGVLARSVAVTAVCDVLLLLKGAHIHGKVNERVLSKYRQCRYSSFRETTTPIIPPGVARVAGRVLQLLIELWFLSSGSSDIAHPRPPGCAQGERTKSWGNVFLYVKRYNPVFLPEPHNTSSSFVSFVRIQFYFNKPEKHLTFPRPGFIELV